MKRTIFILAILMIAAPVWAGVTITATHEGCGVVRIDYTNTEPNRVRAFALDFSVTDGNIIDINDYYRGECNAVGKGYGIFMATIDVNSETGVVDNWGNPVADFNDPNAAGELGSSAITTEMGGLWSPTGDDSPNAPNDIGTLCRITIAPGDCTLNISPNAKRGGVVLSNGRSTGDAVSPVSFSYTPISVLAYTAADVAEWRTVGRPASWCRDCTHATQCHGDADDLNEPWGRGTVWVGMNDVTVLLQGFRNPYSDPVTHPWISADFDHLKEPWGRGTVRVGMNDVNILVAYFRTVVPQDCP
jgi:hypothetical protein